MLAFFTVLCHAAHSVGIVATLPSAANIRAVAKHMFSVADIDGDDEVSLEVLHVVVVVVVGDCGGGVCVFVCECDRCSPHVSALAGIHSVEFSACGLICAAECF